MGLCSGNAEDHCCYVAGERCVYSIDNHDGRRWACGLRAYYGDWDTVLDSPEYQENVKPVFEPLGINCRDWPTPEQHCGTCGAGK